MNNVDPSQLKLVLPLCGLNERLRMALQHMEVHLDALVVKTL